MITCGHCGHRLTQKLTGLDENFEPDWEDHEELVPRGRVWSRPGPWAILQTPEGLAAAAASTEHNLVVNSNDVTGAEMNPDQVGGGCCGNSANVRNRRCAACGVPVGTSINDCWTGYYEYFPVELVTLTS